MDETEFGQGDDVLREIDGWENGLEDFIFPSIGLTFECAKYIPRWRIMRLVLLTVEAISCLLIFTIRVPGDAVDPSEGYNYNPYWLLGSVCIANVVWNAWLVSVGQRNSFRKTVFWGDSLLLVTSLGLSIASSVEINRSVCAPQFHWCLSLGDLCVMSTMGYLPSPYNTFEDQFHCPVPQLVVAILFGFLSVCAMLVLLLDQFTQLKGGGR